jgi:hypothetical protein
MGMIESRIQGTRCYLIQLNPGVDDEKAKLSLERIPGVHALEPSEEPVDMNSMRSIGRKIAHMTEGQDESRDKGDSKREDKDAGVDYLRAYQYFVGQRAFPNDSFDWSVLERGRKHAHQMPATQFPSRQPKAGIASPGQYWEFMGPTNLQTPPSPPAIDFGVGPTNGRVNAVAYDPNNSQTIYAGAAQGGLWKSTDSGSHWTWLSSSWTQLAVNCIVIDPQDSNTIYVGRGDYHGQIGGSYGIMKTTDGGQTWNEIMTSFTGGIGVPSLLMDPTNNQVLVAGTGEIGIYGGLWYSNNGGSTWTQVITPPTGDQSRWTALASTLPNNGNVRFFVVEAGKAASTASTGRLYKSDDHGKTWTHLQSPVLGSGNYHQGYAIATSPTNSNTVYVLDSEHQELYSSANQGGSWKDLGANLPTGNSVSTNYNFSQAWYDFHLECGNRVNGNTNSDVLYLGEIDLQQSLDQGQTWQSLGGPSWQTLPGAITHNDQHALAISPTNPNNAIFSNDGGVYLLSYSESHNTNSITPVNANLANTMFYKIACHPVLPDFLMGGSQDNSTPYVTGDLNNWLNCSVGDGGGCAINQTNPLIQYATGENLNMYHTSDMWAHENSISPPVPSGEFEPFVAAVVLDPNNQSLLYTGTNFLYQYNETTGNWTTDIGNTDLTNDTPKSKPTIQTIAIAPSDSNRIYTGSSDAKLSMSTDAGSTWTTLPTSKVNAAVTAVSVNPTNSSDILIGYGGTGNAHLYRCTNTTATGFFAFSSVAGSGATALPDVSLNAIARDLDDPQNTWYVATDVGIFQTNDAGKTWSNTSYAYGLPDVIVDDLVAVPGTRYLNAGTYGRGMWHLVLPGNGANLTGISISPNPVIGGNSATGTVTLSNPAPSSGMIVDLSGDSTAGYPTGVKVPAGATSATFQVTTQPVAQNTTVHINATQLTIVKNYDLTVLAPVLTQLSVGPSAVTGGIVLPSAVYLTGNAPKGGIVVNLSSNQSSVTVPSSVTIPEGSSAGYFNVTTVPVSSNVYATITASFAGVNEKAALEVEPAQLTGVALTPVLVSGGSKTTVTGTLTFSGPTPKAGDVVKLFSTNTAVATVPASVTVKLTGSQTTATFPVTTKTVKTGQTVTIEAEFPSGQFVTADLGVLPFFINNISTSPSSVTGGSSSTGTVQIDSAPSSTAGNVIVKLSSNSTAVTMPASVSIPVGQTTQTFNIDTRPVAGATQVVISGSLGGVTQQTTLTVGPPTVGDLTISPVKVVGKSTTKVTGTVTLDGYAPSGGCVVSLSSSATAAATVPATVTVAAGQRTATFTITHKKVLNVDYVATITATFNSTSKSAKLTVTP